MHLPWYDQEPWPDAGFTVCSGVLPEEQAELARLGKDRDCLEVGSAYGLSAAAILHGGAKSLTCIDPIPEPHVLASFQRAAAGATLLRGLSGTYMPQLEAQGRKFGLIFIDGAHDTASVMWDLTMAVKLLEPDGVLACHDFLEECCCPDVRQVIDHLFGAENGRVVGSMWIAEPAVDSAV